LSVVLTGEGRVESADGLSLYWRSWLPEKPTAALLFVHGLAEHSGRYTYPVEYFAPQGYACYAFDYRGHGRSPGLKVHVNSFDEFLWDLDAAVALVVKEHPNLPLVGVGHSHGGLILLRYVTEKDSKLRGVVVSSPLLGIHASTRPPAIKKALAHVLSRLLPSVRLENNVDSTYISRDPDVVRAYATDPLVSRKVSVRWFTSFLDALSRVHRGAPSLRVPALVMASGDDHLVDVEATRRWVAAAPPERVTFVVWEGFYHEMFNEPENERVFRKMKTWMEALLAD